MKHSDAIAMMLIPRYQVLGNYPGRPNWLADGDILFLCADKNAYIKQAPGEQLNIGEFISSCEDFPLIFRKMYWWEERTIEQLQSVGFIKYISVTTKQYKYIKIGNWRIGNYFNHRNCHVANDYVLMEDWCYEIATEEEFLNYKMQQQDA